MSEQEIWATIPEFPAYEISTFGRIMNLKRDTQMRTSTTREGDVKISLGNEHSRRTMSVKYLVAEAFVYQPAPLFDAVINLDGNSRNVAAYNLAWRPKWFAWKYVRQFKFIEPEYLAPQKIVNMKTGVIYDSIIDAATSTGTLMVDVWRSLDQQIEIMPTQGPFMHRV